MLWTAKVRITLLEDPILICCRLKRGTGLNCVLKKKSTYRWSSDSIFFFFFNFFFFFCFCFCPVKDNKIHTRVYPIIGYIVPCALQHLPLINKPRFCFWHIFLSFFFLGLVFWPFAIAATTTETKQKTQITVKPTQKKCRNTLLKDPTNK